MRRVEAFLQFLRNVKMDGKRNWRTLAGASRPLLGEFPNRALFAVLCRDMRPPQKRSHENRRLEPARVQI
jgi:hypothetical protein